jgi:hypothetical protein
MKKPKIYTMSGPAYTETETRTGPPLRYVAEKLRRSLESLQPLHGNLVSDDPLQADLHGSCRSAFRNALTAHLALWRRLELKDDEKIVDWLLHLSSEDFGRWLDMTERNGSVSGSIN